MLPLMRRLRWSTSLRMLSSNSVVLKQNEKLRKAQLLKLWNESNYKDNAEIVRSMLAESVTLSDKSLSNALAAQLITLGLTNTEDKYLTIESLDSGGDCLRAVEVFTSLSVEEGLEYIIQHANACFSSALAKSAVDVYHLAVGNDPSLLNNSLLGNCALRLYEYVENLSAADVDKAVQSLNSFSACGIVQLRTYEAIIAAANNAKVFKLAESLYNDFKLSHPNTMVISVETQHLITLLRQWKYKECMAQYDTLMESGIPLNERLVCCVVEACIHRHHHETAIKVLNQWHDQGGILTWSVCRSTMQLATSIDNLVQGRSAPLVLSTAAVASIYQDGFMPRMDVYSNVQAVKPNVYADGKKALKDLSTEQKEQLDRMSFSSAVGGLNPFLDSVDNNDLDGPSSDSVDKSVSSKTPAKDQFQCREERLEFFRQYLVRRVVGRILQTQQESAQYRQEPPIPEDLILMCSGQMVLQGEFDTLLGLLQKDEGASGLSSVVKSVFVIAPIQLMNQNQFWREFFGLIERMRSFQNELPLDIQVAAITRCMLTLFKCDEISRARYLFDSLLPLFTKDASLLVVFAEIIARGELQGIVRILKVLHGNEFALNEDVLIGVLQCAVTFRDISILCNAWAKTDRPEYGDKGDDTPASQPHSASDKLCLALARIVKYARKEEQERFIKYLSHSFAFSPEQKFLLTTGRPEKQQQKVDKSEKGEKVARKSHSKKPRRGPPPPKKKKGYYDDDEDD